MKKSNLGKWMRLSSFMVMLLFSAAVFAEEAAERITVSFSKVLLSDAINQVEKASGYTFFYDANKTDMNSVVSLKAENMDINKALGMMLSGTNIRYRINDRQIVLIPSEGVASTQQNHVVRGTVIDENGDPMIGVNVTIDGTSRGTITDVDGRFTLEVGRGQTLTFSYIGYRDYSVRLSGETSLDVTMKPSTETLDEVVVVGYGTQKKSALSGSVVSVNVADLAASRPVTNIGSALAGQVAGMTVISEGNIPGVESQNITIRGNGTLNNAAPLVIIDGVEGYLNDIDASDIESVTVLKDAASAAIYGSRAANGVILVTTKKGKAGQVRIGYNGYVAFQSANTKPMQPVSNFADHMRYMNEAYVNNNQGAPYDQMFIDEWNKNTNDPIGHPNTNWVDEIFNTGINHNHSVYMQGGTEKVDFYGSVGYSNNEGVVENIGYEKYHVLANITAHVSKYLDMGMSFKGRYGQSEMGGMRSYDSNDNPTFDTGWSFATTPAQIFRYQGMYGGSQDPTSIGGANNPLQSLHSTRGNDISRNGNGKFFISVKPFDGFDITGTLVYDYFDRNYKAIPVFHEQWNFANMTVVSPAGGQTYINQNNFRNQRNYTDVVAHYNHRFIEDKLGVAAMVGASQEMYTTENEKIQRKDLSDPSLSVLSAASGDISLSGAKSTWSMRSYFGRLSLDWENKYYLEGSFRGDGSSRFLKDNRWGWFPSFSAAWRISEEEFMKDNGIFDNLKFRIGYGSLGNNAVSNYAAYSLYSQKGAVMNGQWTTGLVSTSPANPYLTWEKTKTFNVALDFSMLNQRLSGYIEYYNKKTNGILYWVTLPGAGGDWNGQTTNLADVSNKGIELNLNWNDRIGEFRYGISLNYNHNKNNIDKFRGTKVADMDLNSSNIATWEGHEMGSYYMYKARIIRNQNDINEIQKMLDANPNAYSGLTVPYIEDVKDADGNNVKDADGNNLKVVNAQKALGDVMFLDQNGDGKIVADDDRTIVGRNTPTDILGINLTAGWKGFDLAVYMDGAFGYKGYFGGGSNSYLSNSITQYHQIWKYMAENAWRTGNENAAYPKLNQGSLLANNTANDIWLRSRSFWKIRNIQLGYTVPKSVSHKFYVEKLRIFGSLENFFTFTSWKGLDPESGTLSYPVMRQALIGVNVEF
ncbi:MAG: TonB-dependent receptor [Phocaeicola sp.]|nr:TonB-dependent receptor [Phocaeicola sp.]